MGQQVDMPLQMMGMAESVDRLCLRWLLITSHTYQQMQKLRRICQEIVDLGACTNQHIYKPNHKENSLCTHDAALRGARKGRMEWGNLLNRRGSSV